jgi:enamine deaminase RidA (YjgF/YER057c/UK114 family)
VRQSDVVIPESMKMMYDRFHFAPGVRSGDLLRCSGQLGTDESFRPRETPEAQFAQAFENVRELLAAAGLGFGDVVEMTTFHVGLQQHLGTFVRVKDRFLAEPYPAWTAIGVSELAVPGALVEIRVTARFPRAGGAVGRSARPVRKKAVRKRAGKKSGRKRAGKKTARRR